MGTDIDILNQVAVGMVMESGHFLLVSFYLNAGKEV